MHKRKKIRIRFPDPALRRQALIFIALKEANGSPSDLKEKGSAV